MYVGGAGHSLLISCKRRSWVLARPTTAVQVAQEAPASACRCDPYAVSANSFASIDRASRRSRSLHRSTRCGSPPTRYASIQPFLYRFFPRPLAAAAYFCYVGSAARSVRGTAQTIATQRYCAHTLGDLLQDILQNPLCGFCTSSFITKVVAPVLHDVERGGRLL